MQNQLDPQAVMLSKAIRQTESGGNFQAKGKSGEYGAYQFTEPTWNAYSKEAGVNVPLSEATPEQQNQVAYTKIKQWKDAGNNVGQIASMWNAGESNKDAYIKGHSGVNSLGVPYDTGKYAKNVASVYQSFKSGQPTPQTDTSTSQPENPPGLIQSAVQGVTDPFLGLASTVHKAGEQAYGIGQQLVGDNTGSAQTQQDIENKNKEGYDYGYFGKVTPYKSVSDAAGAGIQMGTTLGGIAGAGESLLGSILGKVGDGTALGSSAIKTILTNDLRKGEVLSDLTAGNKMDTLYNALKNGSASEKPLIEQAMKELTPSLLKEAGINIPKLVAQGSGGLLKGIKGLTRLGIEGGLAYKFLAPLWQKYITNQVASPVGSEITVSPAP